MIACSSSPSMWPAVHVCACSAIAAVVPICVLVYRPERYTGKSVCQACQVHSHLGYPDTDVTGTSVYWAPFGRVSGEMLLLFCNLLVEIVTSHRDMPYLWPFPIKMYLIWSYRHFEVTGSARSPDRLDKRGMSVPVCTCTSTVEPVTTDHPLVPAKAVFSSRWSLVRGLHRATIYGSQYNDMHIKMQLIQLPRTCAMPFLFQVKQHLERKTERWRETKEREKITFFADIKFSCFF